MRKLQFMLLIVFCVAAGAAFAQEAVAQVVPAVEAYALPLWLQKLLAIAPPEKVATITFIVGGVLEFIVGVFKTNKPTRLAYFVADIFMGLGQGFVKWGDFLNKILPQRVKAPSEQEPPKAA